MGDCDFCLRALFSIFGDDLSWEDNEEPGRPETWSQVAELPKVYEKLEWILKRRIQWLGEKNGTKRRRRQSGAANQKPLTNRQIEAVQWIGELRSYTQAGKRMGIGRKAAEQHVKAAYKKLGAAVVKEMRVKTTQLPTDKDGQANVTIGSDGQKRIRRNPRRTKPVREDE